ncbi:hypothetical protein JHK85_023379 [Glycine max]|uniref:Uncharacterized protein n=1 Tax=Glycine soja TaxID=3848 RepID=A0A0B2PSP5_GLYSO|nr:hypothetical protein JHK85_023379 [Glycine max]KHN10602.1 hypothetical protein glysoja_029147 [Glycine soja]
MTQNSIQKHAKVNQSNEKAVDTDHKEQSSKWRMKDIWQVLIWLNGITLSSPSP